jgi:hypothetical protein
MCRAAEVGVTETLRTAEGLDEVDLGFLVAGGVSVVVSLIGSFLDFWS